MRQFRLPILFTFILVSVASISAQSRVCVAEIETNDTSISPSATRDALIKFLGNKKGLQREEVPLDTPKATEALAQARDKQCDYLIHTIVSEVHSESGYTATPAGGVSVQNGVNLLTFFVTTNYTLFKVSDAAEQASGSVKASDRGSAQNAVIATTRKIAEKLAGPLKGGAAK